VKRKVKFLTAEIAEHAEIKMDKDARPGMRGKSRSMYNPSRKPITPMGFESKDLRGLCCLFGHPLAFMRRGSRKRKIFPKRIEDLRTAKIRENAERMKMRTMIYAFGLLEENALRSPRALR
jgi:hypothetical protein